MTWFRRVPVRGYFIENKTGLCITGCGRRARVRGFLCGSESCVRQVYGTMEKALGDLLASKVRPVKPLSAPLSEISR